MKQTDIKKYIGLVKWFHDKAKDANYGFIQHAMLGDLFFHESNIEQGQNIDSFRENVIIVFFTQESKKHKDKFEAINIKLLADETDIVFLFTHFLSLLKEKNNYSDYNLVQKSVHHKISILLESINDVQVREQLLSLFIDYIIRVFNSETDVNEEASKSLLKIGKSFFKDYYSQISGLIEVQISVELAHKFWLEDYLDNCQSRFIANILFNISESERLQIFQKCTTKENEEIFSFFFDNFNKNLNSETFVNEELLRVLLKISKQYFTNHFTKIKEKIEGNISIDFAHKFWLEEYFDTCQINFIASILLVITEPDRIQIFQRCTTEDKSNIFFSLLYNIEQIDSQEKLTIVKRILDYSKKYAEEHYTKIINEILSKCPVYFSLDLWLDNYHELLNFNLFKPFIITLSPKTQKKFIKKVVNYIHDEKIDLTVEDLTSLNLINYDTSKLIEQIDHSHFDYSTSIILNVISELKKQSKIETRKDASAAQCKIYDLILKQIKEPIDILQITGYFDDCLGRCSVSISNEHKNDAGEVISRDITYNRNEHHKPKLHPICDGRKAVSKDTKEPILSDENKVEYWWCANQKCFKPSRELHKSANWEKYSLLDFLTILKIEFKESDLEIYLNIINKANRFLKHLKCRECNHILYPKGKTQYAFYGVSNFTCKTEECSEKDRDIYLSHCLNGNCEMEIDSRDSVKCKPSGVSSDTCGWYVCNNCNSCCSSPQLEKRKWVYDNILNTKYKCHLEGHRDLGVISCNKCGDSMETNSTDVVQFERILNWFIDNKEKSERVYKFGQNKFKKWWFVLKRGNDSYEKFKEKLTKYYQVGFQIPDFDKDKELQLISEPIDFKKHSGDILTCKTCGHSIDLTSDLEKARAIKTFHKVKFAKDTTEV